MATDTAINDVRARFLDIEDYAAKCFTKLAKYPDADRDWLLSRAPHMEILVDRLRKACQDAANSV